MKVMEIRQKSSGSSAKKKSNAKHSQKSKRDLTLEIFSLILFAMGAFLFIALLTYDSNDPSVFGYQGEAHAVHNACGKGGALLASFAIQSFGFASYLLPFAFLFSGVTLMKGQSFRAIIARLSMLGFAVLSLTVFVSIQWKYSTMSGDLILTGGYLGATLSEMLQARLNATGASIFSLGLLCIALAIATPIEVAKSITAVSVFLGKTAWFLASKFTKIFGGAFVYYAGVGLVRVSESISDKFSEQFKKRIRPIGIDEPKELGFSSENSNEDSDENSEQRGDDQNGRDTVIEVEANDVESKVKGGRKLKPIELLPDVVKVSPAALGGADAAPILEAVINGPVPEIRIELPESLATGSLTSGVNDAGQTESKSMSKSGSSKKSLADRLSTKSVSKNWKMPTIEFLKKPPKVESAIDKKRLEDNARILQQKFADFRLEGQVTQVRPGPVITLYEFKPSPGVKISQIAALADDLTMAMSAQSVRILAPLPGRDVVGIEVPNETRERVVLREFLQNDEFYSDKYTLPVAMGKDISGKPFLNDLAKMPHLLCAGQTGSGKSVFVNGLIVSLLYRLSPDELRLILVDPKYIEFRSYQDIPHLLLPVVDDAKEASIALKWAVKEMERRYRILGMLNVRNLADYNKKVEELGNSVVKDLLVSESETATFLQKSGGDFMESFEVDDEGNKIVGKLPYIVIVIDELADLMMMAKKDVEMSIARIAQKARASGIHLVIATQRPSTDIITGSIKNNLTSRVSFQLSSFVDSRTIIDRAGAERLLGQGDMLFIPPGTSTLSRLQGAFLTDEEIEKVTGFLKSQGKPSYRGEILVDEEAESEEESEEGQVNDQMYADIVAWVRRQNTTSTSSIQRQFRIGFNRAARYVETLERHGIVGPADGAKPREVFHH